MVVPYPRAAAPTGWDASRERLAEKLGSRDHRQNIRRRLEHVGSETVRRADPTVTRFLFNASCSVGKTICRHAL